MRQNRDDPEAHREKLQNTPLSGNTSDNGVSPEVQNVIIPRSIMDSIDGGTSSVNPEANIQTEKGGNDDTDVSRCRVISNDKSPSEKTMEHLILNGYDSDGELAPASSLEEYQEEYEEPSLPSTSDANVEVENAIEPVAREVIIISTELIMKMKVDELRRELKRRGLRIKGLKSELQETLKKAMVDRIPIQSEIREEV